MKVTQETVYTVRYTPSLEECMCSVRLGYRPIYEEAFTSNEILRERTHRTEAGTRLDGIWYRAMQRAGVV